VEQQWEVTVNIGNWHTQVGRHSQKFFAGDGPANVMGQSAKLGAVSGDVVRDGQFQGNVTHAVDVGL